MLSRIRHWLIISILLIIALILVPTSTFKAQTGITVTTNNQVNLRSGPGTTFSVLARIPKQTTLPAIARDSKTAWIQVNFNGTPGWISASFLTSTGDLTTLPVGTALKPAAFPAPSIPLYDDFAGPWLNLEKWNPQGSSFVQSIDNHTFYFNMSWYLVMFVKTDRSMREISVLFTMEQPSTGNDGLDLVIIGSHTYAIVINHCKVVGTNEIVPDNNWINTKVVNLRDTDCPSTHLLGIAVDGSRAYFYLDGKRIDTRPWTGHIQQAWIGGWADTSFQTSFKEPPNVNDPNFKPTIGRAHSVWIDFAS